MFIAQMGTLRLREVREVFIHRVHKSDRAES